jgi:zinc protease
MTPRPLLGPLLVASLGALAACAPIARWAGISPKPALLPEDTQVIRGRLSNGLTYYIRENHEPHARAELRLAVNAGSVLEDEDQLGMAHMVEHMAFNGTEHFRKNELVSYLESVGMRFGPDINAYTSFDETVYMLTLPTDSAGVLDKGFQIMEDWAHGLRFDSTEVEKERGVVMEEWRLGQGAGARMQDKQFPVLTRNSRYAERLPIGTPESIRGSSLAALKRFYHDWYRPDLMAVVAVGDFDAKAVEQLIREHFDHIPAPKRERERKEYDVPEHAETIVSVATDPEATGSSVSLYLKRAPRPWVSAAAYRDWIVESLASGMITDRLSERTQRPNSPFLDVSSFQGRFIRPLSAYVLNVRVPDGGIQRGLQELLLSAEQVEQHGFTASELERAKRETMRSMEQRYAEREKATSAGYASDYVSNFLYGGRLVSIDTEYDLYRRIVPEVTLREVNAEVGDWMRDRNRVVLVDAPQRDSVRVPTEAELQRLITSVASRPVRAYTDSVSDAPLIARAPTPGRILSERRVDEVGVTEWTLSNGVRVLLKPTDYADDEVLLAARSPGGTSLLPDSDYIAGLTAAAVAQAGGLGNLSAIELRKRLAGKAAGVGADISESFEGLSGVASPRDLETLFQLVYLKFAAPRLDSAAVEAYRTQARNSLADRGSSPDAIFSDTLRAVLNDHNPRRMPPSSAIFDHLNIGRSLEIYRDRFADAGDFTFYIVGTFSPDSIRPLVLRYLASLPSTGRVEQARDLGVRPPSGVVKRVVRKGLEPKGNTQIVFTGDFDFSRENIYALSALADILRLRLRDALREDLGGTYGVSVGAGGTGEPRPQYQVAIGFGADPARIDELTRVVFQQVDSLQRVGPTEEEIQKVREMELRSRETDLRSNHFWVLQMMSYDRSGWDLRGILTFPSWAQSLRPELVKAAASRYLDPANYIQVTLLPETLPAGAAKR